MLERLKTEAEFRRRILMTAVGIFIQGITVGFFVYSDFGMDPFQTFAHGTNIPTGINYGTYYVILNALLLIMVFFTDRKKIGLGTVMNMVLVGYEAEIAEAILNSLFPVKTVILRAVMLAIGIVAMCYASALYFTADLGVSTYDAVALTISERKPSWPFRIVRIATDFICVAIGFAFGAPVGIATVVSAFFMGPLISFFNEKCAIPIRYGTKK